MKRISSFLFILSIVTTSFLSTPYCTAADIDKLAKDDWTKVTSQHFEIITDLDADSAAYLVKDLETFRHFTVDLMGLKVLEGVPPLKILAIDSSSNFKHLDLPENWAGVFSISLAGYAAIASVNRYKENTGSPSFGRQVLLHEYIHHLMRFTQLTRPYPMWYSEGNAEFLGTFRYDGTSVYLGDFRAIQWRAWALFKRTGSLRFDSQKLMNTTELNMTSEKSEDQEAVSIFYGQAFFLMHYINTVPELKTALANYLYDIYLGYPQDLAFERSFKMTYKELDSRVIKYYKKGIKMSVYKATDPEGKLKFPEVELKSESITQAQFLAELTDIIPKFSIFPEETRKTIFNKAIELNPGNYALQVKALMYQATENPDAIIKILEQKIPDNSLLLTYKGGQTAYQADLLRRTGAENWEVIMKEARSFYRRAIKADPFNAMAYMGLGHVYTFLPESEPLREGILGFSQASIFLRDNDSGFVGAADLALRTKDNSKVIMTLRNAISLGNKGTIANYGHILDNLELQLELTGANPAQKNNGLIYEEGSYYQGPLKNGKPHGIGKITRVNGSYYEGEFINGVMQGKGKLWSTHGIEYEGEFLEGVMQGKATVKFPDEMPYTHYTGDTQYGLPHGNGTSTSEKGKYTGPFWWGLQHGTGEFITASNNKHFTGRWLYGRYEWPAQAEEIFVGEINHEGWRTGQGYCRPAGSYHSIEPCEYNRGNKIVSAE